MIQQLVSLILAKIVLKLRYELRQCHKIVNSCPQVMMMHRMLVDLQFFIFLVLIFVIGYGVSTASIINPMKFASFNRHIVRYLHFDKLKILFKV